MNLKEFEFNFGWRKNVEMKVWDEEQKIEIVIDAYYENDEILEEQKSAYEYCENNFEHMMENAAKAILKHYRENYMGIASEVYGEDMNNAPFISMEKEVSKIVKLKQVIICNMMNGKSTIGLTFDCKWDPEHGLGVLIEEGEVKSVGAEDSVL